MVKCNNIHNRGIAGKYDGTSRDGQILYFCLEKYYLHWWLIGSPFLHKTEKMYFMVSIFRKNLDYRKQWASFCNHEVRNNLVIELVFAA